MKKTNIILVSGITVFLLVVIGIIIFLIGSNKENSLGLNTTEDMANFIEKIYEKSNNELTALATNEVDITDIDALNSYTGLTDNENVDKVVVSEPMMTSRAYSLVLIKVKDTKKVEKMKQEISDNINMSKWICVTAEVLYVNSHDDIIFLVMGNKDVAKAQYDAFISLAGKNNGKEIIKESENL